MQKKATEPSIRFAGFRNGWEKRKFDSIFTFLNNNTLSRAFMRDEGAGTKNIHYGDILVKFGECLNVSKDGLPCIKNDAIVATTRNSTLKDGDVIFADTAEDETAGKCVEIYNVKEENVLAGLHTIPCRPSISFGNAYLGYCLNSVAFHAQLLSLMQGIKVLSISKNALSSTNLTFPLDKIEQARIGNFFLLMDDLITFHQRKYEKLVNLKKAMLDKMFPKNGKLVPEVRFAGFSGNWERREMGDIVTEYNDPVATPTTGYYRLGIRSFGKGTFHSFVEPGMGLQTGQMHRVAADKFIVNITFGWEHAVAITTDRDEGKLVSHRFPQFSFAEGMVPSFFKFLILDESFKHHLWLASPGGAGRNRVLKISDMLEYQFWVTSKEEQSEVALFLERVDNLIELQRQKVLRIQNLKKAFLEKMFV